MSGPPLIEVRGLTMGWGQTVLLRRVDFEVSRGEVFVVLGGSGCGKSTLLRHLIGLEQPLEGSVRAEGLPVEPPGYSRPRFGVSFQSGALFGSLTLLENCALALRAHTDLPDAAVRALVRARLSLVGLAGFEHHYPAEVSGGMKKRAAIARALALEPPLLFLDEPSAGLDPVSAAELDELILTLNRALGLTVVLVSHELQSIFRVGARCIFLDRRTQSILAQGDPRALRDAADAPDEVHRFFNRIPSGGAPRGEARRPPAAAEGR